MKKILIIAANNFSKTGVPTVFMNIIRNLVKFGFQFDVIYFDDSYDYYKNEFLSYKGKAFLFDKQYKNRFFKKIIRYTSGRKYYKKTLDIIKNNGPYYAVHSFKEYRSCYFFKAAKAAGVKNIIYHSNNIIDVGGNIFNKILSKHEKRMCLKYITKLIGCSVNACRSAFGEYPFEIINNPYDSSKFYYSHKANYKKDGHIKLVQTSGFCENKNQIFSLNVVAEIKKITPNVTLHFVGMAIEKDYSKKIKEEMYRLGLDKNVVFHNYDIDQKSLFDTCDFFIFPTKSEAFGIVLIEAQACGLECFASDSVPITANVGGCTILPLSLGEGVWANKIVEKKHMLAYERTNYDCSQFTNNVIIPKYLELYSENTIDTVEQDEKNKENIQQNDL